MHFVLGKRYRATADTFNLPDYPPRWTLTDGEVIGNEVVRRIPQGTEVLCLNVSAMDHAVFAFLENVQTGEVYKYQLSLRPTRPWELLP